MREFLQYFLLLSIFSWSTFMVTLLKMIRRLFTTFIDHTPTVDNLNYIAHNAAGASLRTAGYDSLNWLHSEAPCFPVSAERIQIILQPKRFYEVLEQRCSSARDRIMMTSLYLGTGQLESALVANIRRNLDTNTALKVNILLDFTRGTRGEVNSKTMLMPLVRQTRNVTISLYHTPSLRGLSKKLMPPRWNELIGLQHMKLYLFDNTVIISGANLSNDYFTNRQDRYIMIEDKALADFYSNFVQKVQEFSFKVKANEGVELHPKWNMLPYESDKVDFVRTAREKIFNFFTTICEQQKQAAARDDGGNGKYSIYKYH